MYSMLAPNGWTFRKVEMIPGVKQTHDMLIKLSKYKDIPCHVAPASEFLLLVRNDFKPQQNIQEMFVLFFLLSFD